MKTFKTVKAAAKYVNSHKNTGREKTVNGSICFGAGLYCYNEEATAVGLPVNKKSVFYHIINDEELEKILFYLLSTDGYLCIC